MTPGRAPFVAAPGHPKRLGRFELRGLLGRGAQASVWLGWDPTLRREVAVKLLTPDADQPEQESWLREARAMSSLAHPGIVAVHEAQRDGDGTYLVLERVDGGTLADRLRGSGAMAEREAAQAMHDVLDALACAHAQGIVHRDLKPSNILIGSDGRPRVMDFGIAARLSESHDGRIVGTPGYISPEAAAGAAPSPAMDVFAAGMVLAQMLLGEPLRRATVPNQALQQALHEDVRWPEGAKVVVDDTLRDIVLRATARDPLRRFDSAAAMREALALWLTPETAALSASHGTLEFLLRRMRLAGDFPALSDSVLRIQQVTTSDNQSLQALSAEILKDVALTQKLLRMVNTVHFHRSGMGEISTVSRAAALVGFTGIRNMAMSVRLLEHMRNKGLATRMKELFLESLLTATLTDRLTPPSREREEAFLAGMLSHLGRMLAEYYFPEEARRIRARCALPAAAAHLRAGAVQISESQAACEVLGMSFDELGQGVAEAWGLPDSLRRAMQAPEGEPHQRSPSTSTERLRWCVRASTELVQTLLGADADDDDARIRLIAHRYGRVLGQSTDAVLAAVEQARIQLAELALSLHLEPGTSQHCRRLLGKQQHVVDATQTLTQVEPSSSEQTQDMLSAGIADVTSTLAGDTVRLNEVLRMILETMFRALHLKHVVFCLRDPRSGLLTGRFGLGEGSLELARRFKVDLRPGETPDLFASACLKAADTRIADSRDSELLPTLPAWYREVRARSFLILPLAMKGAPFALIYADRDRAIQLSDREFNLLRTLRNQAVMAFKTAT